MEVTSLKNSTKNISFPSKDDTKRSKVQEKLSYDVRNIKKSKTLFVPADKTKFFCKLETTFYKTFLKKNLTERYKNCARYSVFNQQGK